MNTGQICERFESVLSHDTVAICIDGSGFDSTQFSSLIQAVDHRLFECLREYFDRALSSVSGHVHDIDKFMSAICQTERNLFVHAPDARYINWTDAQTDDFKKYMTGNRTDYIPFTFEGLTPSGDPMTTTLGNTLRSIFYMAYYLRTLGRLNTDYHVFASGDDVVVLLPRPLAERASQLILRQTSRDHLTNSTLGQIVKSV